jgi:hypothetical protein
VFVGVRSLTVEDDFVKDVWGDKGHDGQLTEIFNRQEELWFTRAPYKDDGSRSTLPGAANYWPNPDGVWVHETVPVPLRMEWKYLRWLPHVERHQEIWGLSIPLYLGFTGSLVLPTAWLVRRMKQRSRHIKGLCPKCGYDLRATPGCCPECGTAVESSKDGKTNATSRTKLLTPPII